MTSWRFGFLLAVFATCTVWAGGPPDFTRGPEAWAKATLPQSELASLRFEVEMRRAGGPRPVLLETIFKEAGLSADRMWPLWLREACRRRLVDCNAFLRDPRAEGDKELQKIAAIQALGTQARKALYREALRREADTYAPGELRGFDAAMYALAEGMDDLLPDVRRWVGRRTVEQGSARVAERLTLYEAERSSNPAVAVLGSIRRACRDDVDDLLKHDPGHLRSNQLEAEVALARAAFDVLRKLDPPDVLPELKALYGGYRHVAEDYRRRAGELDEQSRAGKKTDPNLRSRLEDLCRYGGALEFPLAQLIGDLGDRAVERRAAYQLCRTCQTYSPNPAAFPIPWDQLYVTERALVQKGEMTESEMVTR